MQLSLFELPIDPPKIKDVTKAKHPWPLHLIGVIPGDMPQIEYVLIKTVSIQGKAHLANILVLSGTAFSLCGLKPKRDWSDIQEQTTCQGCISCLKQVVEDIQKRWFWYAGS